MTQKVGVWLLAFVLVVLVGCGRRSSNDSVSAPRIEPASLPPLGNARQLEPGVLYHEVTINRPGSMPTKLRIYLPEQQAGAKIACVFVAPAGTPLIYGNSLDSDDYHKEWAPYAKAGMASIAYEIDGPVAEGAGDAAVLAGARAFMKAEGGIHNAKLAMDYALARIPNIDSSRLYVAGHSSAATLALQVAQHEPRVAACAAYAPACDVRKRLGSLAINELNRNIPGFSDFVDRISPAEHPELLKCPVFLFHADDDSNVPTEDVATFSEAVKRTNPNVTFARVPVGGHYDSMIDQGIPQAIQWFKSLPGGTR